MTIGEWIIKGMLTATEERLEKLIEMNAPKIMIELVGKQVEDLKVGKIKVGGDKDCLTEAFESVEVKKGRGGAKYYHINGNVNFFPNAKYGLYIKRA